MDWKLAFVLKLEEVSVKFNSTLLETFKKLDDDGNAVLTMTELIEFVKRAEMQVDSSALKELFDFLDRRRDGKVEYGEFLKVLAEAKAEKMRIERINFVKKRTQELKVESQKMMAPQKNIDNLSSVNKTNEIEKMKIKIEGMTSKHTNLLKKNEEIAKLLAQSEQRVKELARTL
jgi:Ca2+-binding EF-hand superfamily protein